MKRITTSTGAAAGSRTSDDPRLHPEAALLPGRDDPARLMTVYLVRRSFFGVLFIGFAIGVIVADTQADANKLDLDTSSSGKIAAGLLTPFALVFVALILRLVTTWVGLALAYPLARRYERDLTPRQRGAASLLDRLLIARALRGLRWSYHVRLVAFDRLGEAGGRLAHADRIIGVVNIVAGICSLVALLTFGATITI